MSSLQLPIVVGLLLLGSLGNAAPAQIKDPGDDGRAWLALLDTRVDNERALEALSFSFRPQAGQGTQVAPQSWLVRYQWREGVGDRVDFQDLEGKLIAPPTTEREALEFENHQDAFLLLGRQLAGNIRGKALVEQFAQYGVAVHRRPLAGREEIQLVLTAPKESEIASVVIALDRRGLPWKRTKTMKTGDKAVFYPSYEEKDGRFVMASLKRITEPAGGTTKGISMAWKFTHVRAGGRLLPSSVEVVGKDLPAHLLGKTEFYNLRIDDRVPPFQALEDPRVKAERRAQAEAAKKAKQAAGPGGR